MRKINLLTYACYGVLLMVLTSVASCQGRKNADGSKPSLRPDKETATLVQQTIATLDLKRSLSVIDSLEEAGKVAPVWANMYRAQINGSCEHYAEAADYRRKVVDFCAETGLEPVLYSRAVATLANYLEVNGHYEEALRVLVPAMQTLMDTKEVTTNVKGVMLATIGDCQLALNRYKDAAESHERAYQCYKQYQQENFTLDDYKQCILSTGCFFVAYHSAGMKEEVLKWVDRTDSLLTWYASQPGADADFVDFEKGEFLMARAEQLAQEGKMEEAKKAFEQYQQTVYAKTENGQFNAGAYYFLTQQYDKAADIYKDYDRLAAEWELEPDLEVLRDYLYPKFRANYMAGRKDTALAVAYEISKIYPHALEEQKNNDAAELATIYETQQKEAQIARQQAALSEQRLWAAVIVFALITVFFVIYTLVRRRAAKRLAEMKAARERIESELRIARDIQMSMVPSIFPNREGLDMYASMTPAKEVGGDLYGYVLQGDNLYFCVGDVSGKGVPASLFMAQATRLFRTLAVQQMPPAEICTHMNDALSGDDNESSMFVTMFLGLIDLQTGHMDFCNAGHNPPVIAPSGSPLGEGTDGSRFLEMLPNAPIGLWPGLEYEGEEIDCIKGRPLFIYTDGLNEAENQQQEQFGDDKLLEILRSNPFNSAQQTIELLTAEVEKHRQGAAPNDDLTMMCINIATEHTAS